MVESAEAENTSTNMEKAVSKELQNSSLDPNLKSQVQKAIKGMGLEMIMLANDDTLVSQEKKQAEAKGQAPLSPSDPMLRATFDAQGMVNDSLTQNLQKLGISKPEDVSNITAAVENAVNAVATRSPGVNQR